METDRSGRPASQERPLVSVIMGVYNCAETVAEAAACIFAQTYENWELILCDDGSKDGTFAAICALREQCPEKVKVLKNDSNQGLNRTLNQCLAEARGDLIARMDGDDVCSPERFRKEVDALLADEKIDIVSTDMNFFDEGGTWGLIQHPTEPVFRDFMKRSPFCHAPCMVKKRAYDAVGGYSEDPKTLRIEDYDLWVRMYAAGFRGRNLHEALYAMRDDRNAYARRKFRYRLNEARALLKARKLFRLPVWMSVYVARPILVGLLPRFLYDFLHKMKLRRPC
ncbi:MAG: glycosyltransferase [Lachnospiraceae bacterium]|nr:glycosyltransferase [Lachnospiraceae bacterium]